MIDSAGRPGRARATALGVAVGLAVVALIGAGRAAAHPDVVDFRFTCSGHRADGHNHSDTMYGSIICPGTRDTFRGLYGDDRIFGFWGDDILLKGSKGDDLVSGGFGADRIEGSDGADELNGGPGQDDISGGDGNDLVRGGDGPDTINCGDGDDVAWGGDGNDTFVNCEETHQ